MLRVEVEHVLGPQTERRDFVIEQTAVGRREEARSGVRVSPPGWRNDAEGVHGINLPVARRPLTSRSPSFCSRAP
jgi:hypothetical protein